MYRIVWGASLALCISGSINGMAIAAEIPEEVLRTEIYSEAISPLDGKLLSAAEYIELEAELAKTIANIPPRLLVSDRLQNLIDLLKLRRLIRQVVPFF